MPVLVFSNGQRKNVGYNTASRIYQILVGDKEPDNERQANFCCQVSKVEFASPVKLKEKDMVMQQILNDKNLTGYNKLVAVYKRIKERTQ
jgi:hypothetical protein